MLKSESKIWKELINQQGILSIIINLIEPIKNSKGYLIMSILLKNSSTSRDTYKNINMDKSYQPLMELLWYSQLPCFDVVNVTTKINEEFGNIIL